FTLGSSSGKPSKRTSCRQSSPKSYSYIHRVRLADFGSRLLRTTCVSSSKSMSKSSPSGAGLLSSSVILNWYRNLDFVRRRLRVFGDIQPKTSACSASKNLINLAWTANRRFLWTLGAYTAAWPVSSLSLSSSFHLSHRGSDVVFGCEDRT